MSDWHDKYGRKYFTDFVARLKAQLGGKCAVCGITKGLEFDHIDPAQKKYNISKMRGFPEDVIQEELAKCRLLCREHHVDRRKAVCGTKAKYRAGCRCDLCREANTVYLREYSRKNRDKLNTQRRERRKKKRLRGEVGTYRSAKPTGAGSIPAGGSYDQG